MKDKDSKKSKQAKIIKLNQTKIQNPLDDLLKDLERIDKTLESHWKEEKEKDEEEEDHSDSFHISIQKKLAFFRTLHLDFISKKYASPHYSFKKYYLF